MFPITKTVWSRCEHKKGQDLGKKVGIYFLRIPLDGKDEKNNMVNLQYNQRGREHVSVFKIRPRLASYLPQDRRCVDGTFAPGAAWLLVGIDDSVSTKAKRVYLGLKGDMEDNDYVKMCDNEHDQHQRSGIVGNQLCRAHI